MELLLNLAWVLLALPAFWLWSKSNSGRRAGDFTPLQVLLALGCILVLLFPVISATDDLHAMRAEMEESATNKRSVRAAGGDRGPVWNGRSHSLLAMPVEIASSIRVEAGFLELSTPACPLPMAPVILRASRAPPVSPLA
jgi:hypothetical protein